ncbi:hypothetical protein [Nonomuraea africana]|uniref:Uncharacterized protein n=1 Tax=Nonomuraea africana TaxID=46171 RepID=A0ABR9KRX0_9ACTN|nr:hypothetical protein [Nonomuraea africana]MBE1564784.1 hypothetical protein [Nonomuraea africana]
MPEFPFYWSLMVSPSDEVAERFAQMDPRDRMRLFEQQPTVYWRALDLYTERLARNLHELAGRLRADRSDYRSREGLLRW